MNTFYPTVFWAWNNLIEINEVKRQMHLFAEQGIKGIFVHARHGLRTPYLGTQWFSAFDAVIDAAKETNLDVWIYDENGWPSGHAGGRVAANGKEFQMKTLFTATNKSVIPEENIVAAYIKNGDNYCLTDNYNEANYFIYYIIESEVLADLMFKKSGEKFIECTHEIYKKHYEQYFGNVIKGVFFDESGVEIHWPDYLFLWSDSLPEEYARLYGEDIRKDLWRLYSDEEINTFTGRFTLLCTSLFKKNFLLPISKWCKNNNLRLTGHFCMEESLHVSLRMTGSVMEMYNDYDISGVDFLGRRKTSPLLAHQLTSVINQCGKKDALCEVFGCAGWDASFNQLFWTWKQFGLYGINMPCIHLSSYSIEGDAKFDHPLFFSYQENRWEKFGSFLKLLGRFTDFNGEGKSLNDILVINPIYSLAPLQCNKDLSRRINNGFRQLSEELDAAQFLYDYGDEKLMAEMGHIENGKLCIGESKYSFVIVPMCLSLFQTTFDLIKKFIADGGKILFIEDFPKFIDWQKSEEISNFAHSFNQYNEYGCLTFAKRNLLKKSLYFYGYRRKVTITDRDDEVDDDEIMLNLRETDDGLHITVFNRSTTSEKKIRLKVNGYRSIVLKDIITDSEKNISFFTTEDKVWCDIEIPPTSHSCFIARNVLDFSVKEEVISVERLWFEKVVLGENFVTMDRATYRSGDIIKKDFTGKLCYIANGKDVQIDYSFSVENTLSKLYAIAETRNAIVVELNGINLSNRLCGWAIDKSFYKYDICDLVKPGENILSVIYPAEEISKKSMEKVQAAYLFGEFNCIFETYSKYSNFVRCKGNFLLKELMHSYNPNEDLTAQGLWFYRGKAKYSTTIKKQVGQSFLKFDGINGGMLEIYVNGKHVSDVVDFYAEYEITEYLTLENNLLEVVLYSTNRNLFGPHHHAIGKPAMVGFQSFMGTKCFTDSIMYDYLGEDEVYDEDMSFVYYYLDKVFLILKEKKK